MSTRINKQALVEELMLQDLFANATKKQVTEFVEDFFQSLANHITAGNEVSIPNFGKFERYEKQDGSYKPKFSAFSALKDAVKATK